jgi:ABC-type Mn2+/Zn2+ transport system permease subunit
MSLLILNIILGFLVGAAAGYIGTIMLSRKTTVMSGPLGHLALPGAALALVYGINMAIGAFPSLLVSAFLIWLIQKRTALSEEVITAIVFVIGVGIALLFLPIDKAEEAFVGDIVNINELDSLVFILITLVVLILLFLLYKKLVLFSISEELARLEGINTRNLSLIYLLSLATVIAIGVNIVGGLLTVAIIALPSATARSISKNLKQYSSLGFLFGGFYSVFGILLSIYTNLPVGPSIIVVSSVGFFASIAFAKSK